MEKDENSCLVRLPSQKAVLVALIVLATSLTLIFIHLSGQWVSQQVFKKVDMPSAPTKSKQRFGSSLTRQKSQERTSKKTGTSWQDFGDSRKKNNELLLDEQSSSRTKANTFTNEADMRPDTNSSEESFSMESFLRERKELDPNETDTADVENIGTLNQTNSVLLSQDIMPGHQTTGISVHRRVGLLPGTIPVHQTITVSLSTPEKALQGTIREAMKQTATTEPHEQRKLSGSYNWNDRDPLSFRDLPLRDTVDEEWKRDGTLIFNRVGKCGSRNVLLLLRKLSTMNNFNLVNSIVYNTTAISTNWQKYIARTLDQVKTPYLFQRHLHFVNFKDFNARQPMYINIIRDPLARFVSNYYFRRFGDGRSNQHFKGTEKEKYISVTDCIINGHKECVHSGIFYIIPFFCGQEKSCRRPSQWALDRAKRNVEKHFVAVGILEDLENSYRVFEKLVPRFFKGVVKLFLDPDEKEMQKNSSTLTKFKEKPSPKAELIMKTLMKYEYEFYYFVKDRLERLKKKYAIGNET